MEKTNQTASQREAQNDIIELGVASVDTHGPGVIGEGDGTFVLPGISEEWTSNVKEWGALKSAPLA